MVANVNQHIPIFICSTEKDLKDHRIKVWARMEKLELAISGMEIFGARTDAPLKTCLKEVSDCKYLIGIIGMRYGSIDDESEKSFVQLEYETANKLGLDILIYLIDKENAPVLPKNVDTDESARKLESFKETLQRNHTTSLFISPDDLADKIERDLIRLFKKKELTFDENKIKPISDEEKTVNVIKNFDLIPKRLKGTEIELILKFESDPQQVSYKRCNTLRLTHGSSVVRDIKIIQPPEIQDKFRFLNRIYAEDDLCDFLIDSSTEDECKVLAQLSFGMERTIVRKSSYPYLSGSAFTTFFDPSPQPSTILKDYDTGDTIDIDNYLTRNEIKAIILKDVIS